MSDPIAASTAQLAAKLTEWLDLARSHTRCKNCRFLNKITARQSAIVNWLLYNDASGRFCAFMTGKPGWFNADGIPTREYPPRLEDVQALLRTLAAKPANKWQQDDDIPTNIKRSQNCAKTSDDSSNHGYNY